MRLDAFYTFWKDQKPEVILFWKIDQKIYVVGASHFTKFFRIAVP